MGDSAGVASAASAAGEGRRPRDCQGCGKKESEQSRFMSCPRCIDLEISPNCFCSQSCFKEAWPRHKALHEAKRLLLKQQQQQKHQQQQEQQEEGSLSPVGYDPLDREAWRRDRHLR
ncbi:hypothetical protein ACSSS7_001767 [Eimeria intestinalis]